MLKFEIQFLDITVEKTYFQCGGFGSDSAWIRIRVKRHTRIRIEVKRRIRIRIKVKINDLQRFIMESWKAVKVQNGGVEAQNGAIEGLYASGRRFASL
jgi:hypothetical protein